MKKVLFTAMLGIATLIGGVESPYIGLGGQAQAQQQPTAGAITARIRQLVNLNRNNPAALQAQLGAFFTANPTYAQYLDEAIAPLNLSVAALQAVGGGLALARANLLAAGNVAGAALIEAEVAALPLVARQQYAAGPAQVTPVVVEGDGEGGGGGPPPSYASFPGSLGGGSSSSQNSPN